MKKVFFALIFGMFFCNLGIANENLKQYEEECLSIIDKPKIKLTSSYGKLKYDFEKDSKSLREETELQYKKQGLEMPKELETMGLTKINDSFEFNMEVGQVGVSQGYRCLYPESIDVFMGYYLPRIYIAKDAPEGSCVYNIALRHEQTHMRIYIEALDFFLPKLKNRMEKSIEEKGVRIVAPNEDVQVIASIYNEEYTKYLKDYVDHWRKQVINEQLKMDSIKQYITESRLCKELEEEAERKKENEDEFDF